MIELGPYIWAPSELPAQAPFWTPQVTLLLVMKDGTLAQSQAKGGKADLLAHVGDALHLLAAWHGERRTNLFTVSRERCVAEVKDRRQQPRISDQLLLDRALVALTTA